MFKYKDGPWLLACQDKNEHVQNIGIGGGGGPRREIGVETPSPLQA
jgi:hypothetical protein